MAAKKPNCWELATAAVRHLARVLFYGPTGTGKSLFGQRELLEPGQRVISVTMTEETPSAELRGHYIPKNGGFEWQDGIAIRGWRAPTRVVLNEIDHASDDALSFLIAFLDDPESACITLPTGETVRPGPGVQVVATMNGDPDALPPALRDRFPVAIHIDMVHPAAIEALPPDLRKIAREMAVLPPERRISIRAWQAFARLREHVGEEMAAWAVFGARAGDVLDALRLQRA